MGLLSIFTVELDSIKMKKGLLLALLALGTLTACISPNRALYDTANSLYGSRWEYLGTIIVFPDVIYKDTISAAAQTREVIIHDGLISYEKMLSEAKRIYGDTVTIANIRVYTEEFKTQWYGRNSEVQALVDVIHVKNP